MTSYTLVRTHLVVHVSKQTEKLDHPLRTLTQFLVLPLLRGERQLQRVVVLARLKSEHGVE